MRAARIVGLRHVGDGSQGILRVRRGRSFCYVAPDGTAVRDAGTLRRIRALAVPPAWTSVWICPHENGHIQATGRDARGRKQYRYHARWRIVRDETKFERTVAFMRALPAIRRRVARDLALPGLPRAKVLAAVVRLLESTFIRVGNEEYARANRSYGLTTLRTRHVKVRGSTVQFRFRGKSGKLHNVELDDERLARIVRRCRDLPGYELFQYVDGDGELRALDSADVNGYLRGITGEDYTAKDFRTYAGTMLAARALCAGAGAAGAKAGLAAAVGSVAERLGNTAAVCRKCYIHPAVIEAHLRGALRGAMSGARAGAARWSRPDELRVVRLIEESLKAARRPGRTAGPLATGRALELSLRALKDGNRLSRRRGASHRTRARPPQAARPSASTRAAGCRASSG